jgi:MipA family protein
LWEIGVVGGGGYLPDYPAADENSVQAIGLPYAVYRGPVFRLGDRGAARGILTDSETIEIDLGVDAAFPVDSDDNDAREGMADLDYLLEVGPRITWRILPRSHRDDLYLALATRAVISTDFANWRYQGITVAPSLTYWRNNLFDRDLNATVWIEPVFGFNGLNDYFYEVRPSDARPGRPAFDADDGYIGTEAQPRPLLRLHRTPARLRRHPDRLLEPLRQRGQPPPPRRPHPRHRRRPQMDHLRQRTQRVERP